MSPLQETYTVVVLYNNLRSIYSRVECGLQNQAFQQLLFSAINIGIPVKMLPSVYGCENRNLETNELPKWGPDKD